MSHLTITHHVSEVTPFLTEGRVVAFPTGTSYGLAVDALQGWALQRLSNLKERPNDKAFTVCVAPELRSKYFKLSKVEEDWLVMWEGQAVTILVKPTDALAHVGKDGLVGLRLNDHPLMAELVSAAGVPLTATSANRSGEEPCYSPECIEKTFPEIVDEYLTYNLSLAAVLDGGTLSKKKPSTIVKIVDGSVEVVRAGAFHL